MAVATNASEPFSAVISRMTTGVTMNTLQADSPYTLSVEELRCLELAGTGKQRGEMAATLNLSEDRVAETLKRASAKLGADNLMAAVAIAARLELIAR